MLTLPSVAGHSKTGSAKSEGAQRGISERPARIVKISEPSPRGERILGYIIVCGDVVTGDVLGAVRAQGDTAGGGMSIARQIRDGNAVDDASVLQLPNLQGSEAILFVEGRITQSDLAAADQMVFKLVDGQCVPALSADAAGMPRVPDGKTVLTVDQASQVFGLAPARLEAMWRAVWGEFGRRLQ